MSRSRFIRPTPSPAASKRCHFSRFDLAKSGIVILGQATQTLPQIMLEEDRGDLYAVGVTGLVYGYWNNLENGTLVTDS